MGSILITRSNPSQGLPATAKSARSRGRVEMLAQLACVGYRFTRSRSPVCNGVAYHPDPAGGANECRRPRAAGQMPRNSSPKPVGGCDPIPSPACHPSNKDLRLDADASWSRVAVEMRA